MLKILTSLTENNLRMMEGLKWYTFIILLFTCFELQ